MTNQHWLKGPKVSLSELTLQRANFYRAHIGRRAGHDIWVVDGGAVEAQIYPEFCYGGNDQRYLFNPRKEIWIDSRCGVEELEYTLRHELIEREKMNQFAWTYERAHNEALAWEKTARAAEQKLLEKRRNQLLAARHVGGFDSELVAAAYVGYVGRRQGARVWIVNGSLIRRTLEPNFCFGMYAHDKQWRFIPAGEIWLESALNAEHAHYVQFQLLLQRRLLEQGTPSGRAYDQSLLGRTREYFRQADLCLQHELKLAPVRYGARDRGVKTKAK